MRSRHAADDRVVMIRLLPIDRADGRDTASDLADGDALDRGLRLLGVEQRAVLVMTHYLSMRAAEIADALDILVGTVQSRLLYATRAMRAVLEADARPLLGAERGPPP